MIKQFIFYSFLHINVTCFSLRHDKCKLKQTQILHVYVDPTWCYVSKHADCIACSNPQVSSHEKVGLYFEITLDIFIFYPHF